MLNILYNDYVSREEFQFEATMESADIELSRAINAYSAICEKADLDMREAELKCAMESGDMDDLELMYEEANDKTSEKKDSLIRTIWEKIKEFFRKIADFFRGKGKKDANPSDEVEVDTGIYGFVKNIKAWASEVASAISMWVSAHEKALKIFGITIGAGAVTGIISLAVVKQLHKKEDGGPDSNIDHIASGVMKAIKGSEFNNVKNDAIDGIDKISEAADKVKDNTTTDQSGLQKAMSIIKAIGDAFRSALSKFTGFITGKSKRDNSEEEARNDAAAVNKIHVNVKYNPSEYAQAKKAGVSPVKYAQMAAEAEVVSKLTGKSLKWNNYSRFTDDPKVKRLLGKWRKSDEAKKAAAAAKKLSKEKYDKKVRGAQAYVDNLKSSGWLDTESAMVEAFVESVDEFFYNIGAYKFVSESYMESVEGSLNDPFDDSYSLLDDIL